MPSVKFPLAVNLESVDGTTDRGKIVNGYAELASAQEATIFKRPALTLSQGSFAAFGQGMSLAPNGQMFVISGGDIYSPVGGVSGTALCTHSGTGGTGVLFRVFGNYIYALHQGTNGAVYRAAPPFTAFSSIGNHGGKALADAIAWRGTLYTIDDTGTGGMRKTANGTSWSAPTNQPGPTAYVRFAANSGTLGVYQTVLQNADCAFSTDGGASVWVTSGVGTMATSLHNWIRGSHAGQAWAIAGTGNDDIYASPNLSTWTAVNTSPGFPTMANISYGSVFASHNNTMYVAVTTSTNYEIWASGNNAASFAKIGSISVGSVSNLLQILSANGGVYAALSDSSFVYRIYRLDSDGTMNGITPLATLEVPPEEIVSIVGTEAGTTFVKTTIASYTISGVTVTQVTDAQYPATTVRGAVYLNGRLYVMEPDGTIWNSAEDDFTSWAGTDFVSAEFEADKGVCLAKQGEYVIALGQYTTEAFYDAGNATGSPLSPVNAAVMLIGCAHANSVSQTESSLVWVAQQKGQGSTFHKGRFVVIMTGYGSYTRISTPDVERILDQDAFSQVYADILTISGHVFYILSLGASDTTLVYDFRSKLWYEWTLAEQAAAVTITSLTQTGGVATAVTTAAHGYSDGDQVVIAGATPSGYNGTLNVTVVGTGSFTYPVSSAISGTGTGASMTATGYTYGMLDISASCYFNNEQLVQLRESGDVYVLDIDGTTDNGVPIDWRIRTRLWDGGNNKEKFMGDCEVVGDRSSTTALIRFTDDEYQTYTKFRRLDMSLRRPRTRRGGSFTRRAVEFRQTLPAANLTVDAIQADVEQGAV